MALNIFLECVTNCWNYYFVKYCGCLCQHILFNFMLHFIILMNSYLLLDAPQLNKKIHIHSETPSSCLLLYVICLRSTLPFMIWFWVILLYQICLLPILSFYKYLQRNHLSPLLPMHQVKLSPLLSLGTITIALKEGLPTLNLILRVRIVTNLGIILTFVGSCMTDLNAGEWVLNWSFIISSYLTDFSELYAKLRWFYQVVSE